jgi:hypothetical protein
MARIAFFHNALGKTDGVSLEVDKWKSVLEKMGHTVYYCAGNNDVGHVHCIPQLCFMHPKTYELIQNATVQLKDYDEKTLKNEILTHASIIKKQLLEFIDKYKIEVLIPNNLLSVGYHIPALIALSQVIKETKIPTIAHNHDFYFEDSGEVSPTCKTAWSFLDTYSPPVFPNVQNIVINRLAQAALKKRKNISAAVVPNVFDFEQQLWAIDDYNKDFRKSIGLADNDIFLLQATRVMDRKAVELSIDVTASLNMPENRKKLMSKKLYNGKKFGTKSKIVLVCAGRIEKFGASGDYQQKLTQRAKSKNVDIRFIGDYIKHSRGTKNGKKIYSLWDSYVHADFVTYPSIWEGWGNQLIEAVFAKLPVVIFEYPVYVSDLKKAGFNLVSIGSKLNGKDKLGLVSVDDKIINKAAVDIADILTSSAKYGKITSDNFKIAKERYSYQALEKIIVKLFKNISLK